MQAGDCCSMVCQNGVCGAASCLPPGSNCNTSQQCCMGLACDSGHCGAPIDAGSCTLDPGGTPCSQCVVAQCCNQTQTCLNDPTCASSMACIQSCTQTAMGPGQCAKMCCSGTDCGAWFKCVNASCGAIRF